LALNLTTHCTLLFVCRKKKKLVVFTFAIIEVKDVRGSPKPIAAISATICTSMYFRNNTSKNSKFYVTNYMCAWQ
jgi:hypothetical protein